MSSHIAQAPILHDQTGVACQSSQFKLLGVVFTAAPAGTVTLTSNGLSFTASTVGWNAAPGGGLWGSGALFYAFSNPSDLGAAICLVQPL
jgi:hypothetical protein